MPTVLITGANRGIGLELARQYARDDWRVLACARRQSPESQSLAETHADFAVYPLELTDHQAIDALADAIAEPIDVLLLSAGTMGNVDFASHGLAVGGFGQSDFDDWRSVLEINTLAPMKMAEAFVTHVAQSQQKKIVALTSMVASMGINTAGGLYAYRASKAGLNAIMRSMAVDLAPRKIVAAPIHPGWTRTDMGGANAPVSVEESASGIRQVIAGLSADKAGRFWCFDGSEMPW